MISLNKNMKKKSLTILICMFAFSLWAQSPKREMRASWLATVYQLDWPKSVVSQTGNEVEINTQKRLMTRILDSLVSANMNAVCFQVRSRCDAMYRSSYEPWASDLVKKRGLDPGYDPLAFVVEEGHKRGLEVHAWVNPYRYESSVSDATWNELPNDYRVSNPEWILQVGNASILDPGLPAVKQRITDVIQEVVENYDIDGVLFDDYFYLQGISTQDAKTYAENNPNGLELADWRRRNVNDLIANVYNMIQEKKPYVKFGVSPAGVWDVSADVAASYGITLSNITAGYAYNGIYCDPVAWLYEGTVDYISPQIYWTIGSSNDYSVLAPWWAKTALHFGKNFYSSHSISGLSAALKATRTTEATSQGLSSLEQAITAENNAVSTRAFGASEVAAQIQINRDAGKSGAPGSIFYATTKIYSTKGFIDYLKSEKYANKALTPAIHWKNSSDPGVVNNIDLIDNTLRWNSAGENMRYAIYALPKSEILNSADIITLLNTSKYYLGLSYVSTFTLPKNVDLSSSVFAVAIVDRYGNEYAPVVMGQESLPGTSPQLVYPDNGIDVLAPFSFKWKAVENAISYIIEISLTQDFTSVICAREVTENLFSTHNLPPLVKEQNYYWRVKTKTIGNISEPSEIRNFTCSPFAIITPENKSTDVSLSPTIVWSDAGREATYLLEVSSNLNFSSSQIVFSQTYNTNTCQLTNVLVGGKTYYLRVKAQIEGEETITDISSFTTIEQIPEIPVVISPVNNSHVSSEQILVKWSEEPRAKSFRVELSSQDNFPPRQVKVKQIEPYTYETFFEDISAGTYYLRMRSEYFSESAILYTDWCPTVTFYYSGATGIKENMDGKDIAFIRTENDQKQLVLKLDGMSWVNADLLSVSGMVMSHIYDGEVNGEANVDIPVDNLSQGIYLIKIDTGRRIMLLKFAK